MASPGGTFWFRKRKSEGVKFIRYFRLDEDLFIGTFGGGISLNHFDGTEIPL